MTAPLKGLGIGVAGCGNLAYWTHLPLARHLDGARLVGASDPDREARRRATKRSSIPVVAELDRITEDALRAVAEEAHRRKSGARGLRAILEEIMLDVMYEIPSLDGVVECVVDRAVVEKRERPWKPTRPR